MESKEAINELRNSYELKNKKWAKRCLDTIEEELEKKDKIIDEALNKTATQLQQEYNSKWKL